MKLSRRELAVMLVFLLAAVAYTAVMVDPADAAEAPAGANCKVITHRGLYKGTENQLAGVTEAGRWGWAEVDADMTADGKVIGFHDGLVGRLTGGDLSGFVDEHTFAELNADTVAHPFGKFRLTTSLIGRAAIEDVPIMVTINRWSRRTAAERELMLDTLEAAAEAHPRPQLVYLGGFGMRPDLEARGLSTYVRYAGIDTRAEILADVQATEPEVIALHEDDWTTGFVSDVRAVDGARIATRQVLNAGDARAAQAAGINYVQGNDAQQIATAWCLP